MRPRIDIRFVTMPGLDAGPAVARIVWIISRGHGGAACPLQPRKSVVLLDILGRQVRTKVGVSQIERG